MPKLGEAIKYLGVDPGASGGLVCIRGREVEATAMPDTEADVWEWFSSRSEPFGDRSFAVIEWIHPAIQAIGKSSMSKLYGSYMSLRMAVTAARIPHEIVQASKWQKGLGIPGKRNNEDRVKWKNMLKSYAQKLFPGVTVTLATADALLIAEYCRRLREGKLGR